MPSRPHPTAQEAGKEPEPVSWPCEANKHNWPSDADPGDTCNCGEWYLHAFYHGNVQIERRDV